MQMNGLANNNRVINNNPNHEQEGKDRKDIKRNSKQRGNRKSPCKGNQNANTYPRRHSGAQEKTKENQYKPHAEQRIAKDKRHHPAKAVSHIDPHFQLYTSRQGIITLFNEFFKSSA